MILTIDTGGTKTLVGLFSEEGQLLRKERFETPKDYPIFLEELQKQLLDIKSNHDVLLCSIGMPGRIDYSKGSIIAFGNLPWVNIPIIDDLKKILPDVQIFLQNDAKLAGLAAALHVPQYKRALYITVSTGIGTCFVVDGHIDPILASSEAGQAEIEHNGKLEKWEHFASGSAIVRDYGKRASEIEDPKIWKEISHKICLGLFEHIAILQPDVLIFGGGVGAHLEKYKHFIEEELSAHPNPLVNCPAVVEAMNAEDAVLFGGYAYAMQMQENI